MLQSRPRKKYPVLKVLKYFIFEAGQRRNQSDFKFVLNQKKIGFLNLSSFA